MRPPEEALSKFYDLAEYSDDKRHDAIVSILETVSFVKRLNAFGMAENCKCNFVVGRFFHLFSLSLKPTLITAWRG